LSEEENNEYTQTQVLWIKCMELAVNVGLMGSVAGMWPLEIQQNWEERIDYLIGKIDSEIEKIQLFGEAFDEDS
jgi:hypothetical protein